MIWRKEISDLNKHNRSNRKFVSAVIALFSIVMVGTVAWQPIVQASVSLPQMTLTLVALDSTQMILHQNDIGNLTSYRAYGGIRKSNGQLANLGNYTGVPIKTFLNMVGGIRNGYSVKIIAFDSTIQTLSYKNLNGTGLNTYNNVTGALVQHNQTLTPMLAYYCNDNNLTSGGPLRLVIVGPEGLCTDGSLWVKNVVRLEIHANLQPMSLTVVGSNGTELVLNETGISVLPALRAVGGRKKSPPGGIDTASFGNYTGVPINTFCNLVGGLHLGQTLRVTSSDTKTKNFTYTQVNGDFVTYNVSGNQVPHYQPLTTILAYHFKDMNLSSSDGPLRFAIVGSEGLYTDSSYWWKQVVKLEILGTAQYTLAVDSSPTGVNFTVNGTSCTTSWSGIYNDGSSVSLVMPEIHTVGGARYYWNHWSDGNASRSRTVTITEDTTLTAYYTGPYYELTVNSSPIAGIPFTINGTPQTTPYSEWCLAGSHTLKMPEAHNEYVWSHWLEDGALNRTKTITLTGSTTWTGIFVFAVPPHGPTAEFTATPETAKIGESVKFDASSSQSGWNGTHERPVIEYRWDFGDGNEKTTFIPTIDHSFTGSGNYYITLTVYASGATPETGTATHKVTVISAPVGGYSIPLNRHTTAKPLMSYFLVVAILASIFITVRRRKMCRKKD